MKDCCRTCKGTLDAERRGNLCGRCWTTFVRSQFKPGELAAIQSSTRLIEGNGTWFVSESPAEAKIEQGVLF